MNTLSFEDFFHAAIREWPSVIDMKIIKFEQNLHTIDGLYEIQENIVDKCLGIEGEAIFVNMHNSIYTLLLRTGEYVINFNMNQIRKSAIEEIFKKRIEKCISNKFEIYDERDISKFKELLKRVE
ncbi:hypothetical protein [Comamonas odontotermitis]|uniref:hypothetical protein n=1 Tax=Comamonas odontotermitis TaxID=379895 RepID=UPI001CC3ED61|nr:hypothetical protein [Comamonas odontotermitis]UBB17179.1 hypothetical protein LAD35_00515 [Comamonas odontotermitis]